MLTLVAGCGGGGGNPSPSPLLLPPFTSYSTDLALSPLEGTAGAPLKIAPPPRCAYLPYAVWQAQVCEGALGTVWPKSNAMWSTLADQRWRVIVNVENAWDTNCNTGPPAQSLPGDTYPINVSMKANVAVIGFELANEDAMCQKIPYVALNYVRGVQGDGAFSIAPWGRKPILVFDGALEHTVGPTFAQSIHFYAHYRAGATRYMAHTHLWQSGYEPPDFTINWNWPVINSYYYPGAWIHGGDSSTCPGSVVQNGNHWTVDVEALALCRFPEFVTMKPDFLGFEIAVEGAYLDYVHKTGLPNRMAFTISNPSLTLQ